jgi:hypothetical protein
LAKSENRALSAAEESSGSYATSEVVLAFPLTETSEPMIEPQKVFAFLPLRQMGFNVNNPTSFRCLANNPNHLWQFLIHADFVTQANREDIVTDSPRNRGLANGIAEAFIKAVLQFCRGTAQYTWMRYLPRKRSHHWDPFWGALVERIEELLGHERILYTRGMRILRPVKDLRYRMECTNDRRGNPLFEDLRPELYLSDAYADEDIKILEDVGLEALNIQHCVDLARQDLASASSRFKSPATDEDWHHRAASLLSVPFQERWKDQITQLRMLKLIPLVDGSWVAATEGNIFYSDVNDILLPGDLGLRLVSPAAATNAARRTLFDHLGVQSADVANVRSLIFRKYARDPASINFSMSLSPEILIPHSRLGQHAGVCD